MKFCKYCGRQIDENAIFCQSCGARVNDDNPHTGFGGFNPYYGAPAYSYDTQGSLGVAILSFLFWQAGLILWFFWRVTNPGKARSASKGALSNVSVNMPIIGLVLWLIWKDDNNNKDLAKVVGISAIVGAAIYALAIIAMIVMISVGAVDESIAEFAGSFMA